MPRPERIEPGPGQESVWDYPRPPALDPTTSLVRVVHAGRTIAETTRAIRILETSQPPGFYLPPDDVDLAVLVPSATASSTPVTVTVCATFQLPEVKVSEVGETVVWPPVVMLMVTS